MSQDPKAVDEVVREVMSDLEKLFEKHYSYAVMRHHRAPENNELLRSQLESAKGHFKGKLRQALSQPHPSPAGGGLEVVAWQRLHKESGVWIPVAHHRDAEWYRSQGDEVRALTVAAPAEQPQAVPEGLERAARAVLVQADFGPEADLNRAISGLHAALSTAPAGLSPDPFAHLAGRSMYELRADELTEYVMTRYDRELKRQAVEWIVSELKRKTNDERILANKTELLREDIESLHKCLDEQHVPRADANGNKYSMWGRVMRYGANMRKQDLEILARIHHAHANALQVLMTTDYDKERLARWMNEYEDFRELYKRLAATPAQPVQQVLPPWRSIAVDGPPAPEVFVLCWDGKQTFVEWFGSKPDAGRGVTHWIPYDTPPGTDSEMHDGRRALRAAAPPQPVQQLRDIAMAPKWERLMDSDWSNIVNAPSVLEACDSEEAVKEAVKLTEARLRELNASQGDEA